MTLIKKFAAPLTAVALVAVMAVSLIGQTPRIASAAAGEVCKVGANATSSFLGNGTSTGVITSVNSGTTTTMRIHIDDLNAVQTVGMTASAGAINGQAAVAANIVYVTTVNAAAQLCVASGMPNTAAGAVATTVSDAYIQFSFTAPTLPSGIQSQLIQFRVDGNNDGDFADAQDATYFLTVATAAATLTVGTPDDLNIPATAVATDAGGAAIVVTVKDASGTNITGATVDVVSSAGGLDQSGAPGTCDFNNAAGTGDTTPGNLSQSCSAQTDGNGQIIPTLYGLGGGGISTVTFTVRGTSVTGSTTVIISALPATLELSGRRSNSATSLIAKGVVRNTDSTTTDQDELMVVAVARDGSGNVVGAGQVTFTLTGPGGHTILFATAVEAAGLTVTGTACSVSGAGTNSCVDAIEPAAAGATTPSHAVAYINVNSTAGEPLGTYTVTATVAGNNATITGTMTFTLARGPASLSIADIPNLGLGASQSVPITCRDADGNPCPSGTLVQVNVSNANLIAQNAATGTTGITVGDLRTTDAGIATVSLIGVTPGSTNIVANVATITAVKAVTVGTAPAAPVTPPPAAGTGTFTGGTIAPAGVSIVAFTGTTAQLNTAGTTARAVSVSATVGGRMITFVVGAPDFVNAEFNAAFPTGLSGTLVIIKTGT